jgi:16S rRNA (guanine527-N7)-methyltransferase
LRKHTAINTELEHLEKGSALLGIALKPGQIETFSTFLSLLILWNSKINLTSIRNPHSIIRLHFLDSLAVSPYVDQHTSLVDIGSGPGFPGLALKIAFPEKEITLVESRRKKASFLKEVVRRLGLKGVRVLERRMEDLQQEPFRFNETITRAFSDPSAFLSTSYGILSETGKSFIMQGPTGLDLFASLEATAKSLHYKEAALKRFRLPLGAEDRTLLIFAK